MSRATLGVERHVPEAKVSTTPPEQSHCSDSAFKKGY